MTPRFLTGLKHVTTFEEAVDEIYNSVGHMQPTINREGDPSSGFVLIFRLFCFRLNEQQMMTLLNHRQVESTLPFELPECALFGTDRVLS